MSTTTPALDRTWEEWLGACTHDFFRSHPGHPNDQQSRDAIERYLANAMYSFSVQHPDILDPNLVPRHLVN